MISIDKQEQVAQDVSVSRDKYRDTKGPIRIGVWTLLLGLGVFLAWAAYAPLDEGVPSTATVMIDTKRKAVQHPAGGVVKEVLVKEGQSVKEGELLMRINDANAMSLYESVRHQYFSLRAMQARLLAEKSGSTVLKFHPDLVKATSDPLIANNVRNQQDLFNSRRASLSADLQAMQENLAGLRAQLQGAQDLLAQKEVQLRLLTHELENSRELMDQGYMPRQRGWELERQIADVQGSKADLVSTIEKSRRSIAEALQRISVRKEEYAKEVDSQLAEVIRQVDAEEKHFEAVKADLARTEILSPAEGQVLGLAVQTVGGVIQPGQKVMDIVPDDEGLILEAKIAPHLIDKVSQGNDVDIRFSTFAHSPQMVVAGKILSISKDLLTEAQPTPGQLPSYYLARVAVTPEGLKKLGNHQMQAGMPAEVVIKTGERSLLAYLMHPLLKRMAASMKEE